VAFDLLCLDSADLLARPWEERRAALLGLALDQHDGPWRVNPVYDDGADLLAATGHMGLEGVVAKNRRSVYRRGVRTRWWLKCKNMQRSWMDVFGWQPPRRSTRGGLIVGDNGRPASVAILALPADERRALLEVIHRYGERHGERLYVPPGAIQADVTYLERTPRGFLRHAAVGAVRAGRTSALAAAVRSPRSIEAVADLRTPPRRTRSVPAPRRLLSDWPTSCSQPKPTTSSLQ
jgi:ATP-dependent DNA ligase